MRRLLIIFIVAASVVQLSADNNSPFDDMKKTWDSLSRYRLVAGTKALIQGLMGEYGLEIIYNQLVGEVRCSCNKGIVGDFSELQAGNYFNGFHGLAKRCTTLFGMSYASYYLLRHCCWPNMKYALAI